MINIKAHINNVALHHTIFDLPFAFMGAVLAAHGSPTFHDLLWIAIAITTGRAAALALDNLADLKYDSQQPRMSYRAMVRGEITKNEAKAFIVICLLLMVLAVMQLHPICIYLLPLAAAPFLIYPLTKRFTGWCHLFLGVAYLDGKGCYSFRLHSLAVSYGAPNAFKLSAAMHVICIACFFAVGIMMSLGQLYFIGVGIAAGTLVYQHRIVSPTDFSQVTQRYFMRNGIVSVAIFVCTWLSFYL